MSSMVMETFRDEPKAGYWMVSAHLHVESEKKTNRWRPLE